MTFYGFPEAARIPGYCQVGGNPGALGCTVYHTAGYIQHQGYRIQDTGYTETQRHRDTDTQRQRYRIQDQANASQPGGPSIEGAGGYNTYIIHI